MGESMAKIITLKISRKIVKMLDAAAAYTHLSRNMIILEALEEYVEDVRDILDNSIGFEYDLMLIPIKIYGEYENVYDSIKRLSRIIVATQSAIIKEAILRWMSRRKDLIKQAVTVAGRKKWIRYGNVRVRRVIV